MIRTLWMKTAYIIILIAAALFAVLYLGSFSVILLCILLILPVIFWLSLWYIRFSLDVSIETDSALSHRNMPQFIKLVVKNKSFLPVGKAAAMLVCSGISINKNISATVSFPIPARNVTTVQIRFSAPHCGLTDIKLKYLQITDYIRLFSRKIRYSSETSVLILPCAAEINYELNIPCSPSDEESCIYSKLRPGNDPSEIYRIREYRPGDMPKRIHWKLSSRTDTTWVKEYSLPISQRAAVLVDYSFSPSIPADLMDIALDAAYSISMALIKQEIPVVIYWVSGQSGKILWNEVLSAADLNGCFSALLSHKPVNESDELLKQSSDLTAVHSTNALYYCTPRFDLSEIKSYFRTFKENRLHVITSESSSMQDVPYKNIIFVREGTISEDLRTLSSMEVKHE